ncbi:hypothetical protein Rhopal_005869-T1 [Rhodotorula paludigena]|uniref:Casein kinase II subunit beta n=1 Tax=Rhodotorula paludigena TaxID=86838 RepID=A0AAV5GTI7_9BASI|nr:hypothetical protein Rhopal_005869-T1 [Rhodotorula paludigena]
MAQPPADPDRALPRTYPGDSAPTHEDGAPAGDDDDLEDDDDQQEIYETDTLTWINWFCSLPGHEYFTEVAEDFIEDDFNLTGLASLVPFYKEAMEMVLDVEPEEDEMHRVPDVSIVESSAELLYGLIHQRYILTRQGLQQMYAKFDSGHFGTCPRVYCSQSKLVPCGRSDLPGVDTVKLFCPSCLDMYVPPSSRFQGVDGAFFGTTFPHLLFQTYPPPSTLPAPQADPQDASKREQTTPLSSLSKVYVPRIYGFKVSERARSGPRMQWMRMRPRTEGEIDWDENAVDVDPAGGAGGSGGKGALFDDENLDEEDEAESEEEEEAQDGAAGAPEGGAAKGDKMVEGVASALGDARLSSAGAASASGPPSPAAASPTPRVYPLRTDREIRPLPRSPTARTSASNSSPAPAAPHSPAAPSPLATANNTASTSYSSAAAAAPAAGSISAEAASTALAASIQRHLAAAAAAGAPAFALPSPPQPAAVGGSAARRERERERDFGGAAQQRAQAIGVGRAFELARLRRAYDWFDHARVKGGLTHSRAHPLEADEAPCWLGFGDEAQDWDAFFSSVWTDLHGPTVAILEPTKPARVLDVGCGPYAHWILSTAQLAGWEHTHFVALDLVPSLVVDEMLPAGVKGRVEFVQHNVLGQLPFPDDSFDYVRVSGINSSLPENIWDQLIESCARVLRPWRKLEILDPLFALYLPRSLPVIEDACQRIVRDRFINLNLHATIPPALAMNDLKSMRTASLPVVQAPPRPPVRGADMDDGEERARILLHLWSQRVGSHALPLACAAEQTYKHDAERAGTNWTAKDAASKVSEVEGAVRDWTDELREIAGIASVLEDKWGWKCAFDEQLEGELGRKVPLLERDLATHGREPRSLLIEGADAHELEASVQALKLQKREAEHELHLVRRRMGLEPLPHPSQRASMGVMGGEAWVSRKARAQ